MASGLDSKLKFGTERVKRKMAHSTIVRQKPLFHVRLGLNNHPDQLYYQKGAVLISQKAPNTE